MEAPTNKDIITLRDYNIGEFLRNINGANTLFLDREYKEIHIDCILPPRIDAIIPTNPINGMELHATGKFYLYGKIATEAHLMLWNRNWWNRTTR